MKRIITTCALAFVAFSPSLKAQSNWTGNVSEFWNDSLNWSNNVPGYGTTAVLSATLSSERYEIDLGGVSRSVNILSIADSADYSIHNGSIRFQNGLTGQGAGTSAYDLIFSAGIVMDSAGVNSNYIRGIGSSQVTLGGPISLTGGSKTISELSSGGNLLISGDITGNADISIGWNSQLPADIGMASVILSGNNSHYSGNITMNNSARVQVGSSAALGTGTLSIGSTVARNPQLSSNSTATRQINNATVFSSTSGGQGNFTVLGDSTHNGKLTFSNSVGIGRATDISLTKFRLDSDVEISGLLSERFAGNALTLVRGSGLLTLSHANNGLTGAITLGEVPERGPNAGTARLRIAADHALGSGELSLVAHNAVLELEHLVGVTVNNVIRVSATQTGGTVFLRSLQGDHVLGGNIEAQGGTIEVGAGSITVNGLVTDTSSAHQLRKSGSGTLVLNAANSYQAQTWVDAGRLLVNGITTEQGAYQVADEATLGGSGTIGLAASVDGITLANGARISPGGIDANGRSLAQTLAISGGNGAGLIFEGDALIDFQLGSAQDYIDLRGASMTGSALGGSESITFEFSDYGGLALNYAYDLIGFGGTPAIAIDAYRLSEVNLNAGWLAEFQYQGDTLQVIVTSIPEPGSMAFFGLGVFTLIGAIRRRS